MKRPNIVHIISRLNQGGIELRTLGHYERHRSHYGDVHIWLTGRPGGDLEYRAAELDITLHHKRRTPKNMLAFGRFLLAKKIDVVHSHVGFPSGPYLAIAKRMGVKSRIAHYHSEQSFTGGRQGFIVKELEKLIARSATQVWSVSQAVIPTFQSKKLKKKAHVLYNGYDFESPRDQTGDTDVLQILHVGRFHAVKNHAFLWEILARVERPFEFTACGRHDDDDALPPVSLSEAKPGQVKAPGQCHDVRDRLLRTHLFLFPSKHEGLGGALIEAASMGCYCIASDIPAHREVAHHFKHIQLIPLSDPDAWVHAIENTPLQLKRATGYSDYQHSPFTVEAFDREWKGRALREQ